MKEQQYAVWWASAGCLPDSEHPAFVGTAEECVRYMEEDPDGYFDTVGEHNTYMFTLDKWDETEEEQQ